MPGLPARLRPVRAVPEAPAPACTASTPCSPCPCSAGPPACSPLAARPPPNRSCWWDASTSPSSSSPPPPPSCSCASWRAGPSAGGAGSGPETAALTLLALLTGGVDRAEQVVQGQHLTTYGPLFPLYVMHIAALLGMAVAAAFRPPASPLARIKHSLRLVGWGTLAAALVGLVTNVFLPYSLGDFRLDRRRAAVHAAVPGRRGLRRVRLPPVLPAPDRPQGAGAGGPGDAGVWSCTSCPSRSCLG